MTRLTRKQQRFIDAYIIDFNPTQAALRAGYSPAQAARMGAKNMAHTEVLRNLRAQYADVLRNAPITLDTVLRELMLVGCRDFRNLDDFFWLGKWKAYLVGCASDDLDVLRQFTIEDHVDSSGQTVCVSDRLQVQRLDPFTALDLLLDYTSQ